MRLFFITLAVMASLANILHAAPTTKSSGPIGPQTKIEKAIDRRGEMYTRDIYEAGSVSGKYDDSLQMEMIIISSPDIPANPKEYGIKFDYKGKDDASNTGYLDFDEAKDLSTAINDMETLASKMSSEDHENTEVHYKTRDDMDFGFYQTGHDQLAYVGIDNDNCFLTMENFQSLKVALDQAIARLAEKGAVNPTKRTALLLPTHQ